MHMWGVQHDEVIADRLKLLRNPEQSCFYPGAIKSARSTFQHLDTLTADICLQNPPPTYDTKHITYRCALFARKFPEAVAPKVLSELQNCTNGLDVLCK